MRFCSFPPYPVYSNTQERQMTVSGGLAPNLNFGFTLSPAMYSIFATVAYNIVLFLKHNTLRETG